jgi:hypothetical protein
MKWLSISASASLALLLGVCAPALAQSSNGPEAQSQSREGLSAAGTTGAAMAPPVTPTEHPPIGGSPNGAAATGNDSTGGLESGVGGNFGYGTPGTVGNAGFGGVAPEPNAQGSGAAGVQGAGGGSGVGIAGTR